MMDAQDDTAILFQKASSDLLWELRCSLPKLLYHKNLPGMSQTLKRGTSPPAMAHMIKLLEPFQEWPQLLDPQLDALVSPMANAFLKSIQDHPITFATRHRGPGFKFRLTYAVSKLLYTLCKIRGSKVISRFLNNEPKYLEPLLEAFEVLSSKDAEKAASNPHIVSFAWEEQYMMLLWLSHLLLTPFDLSSVASSTLPEELKGTQTLPNGPHLPPHTPNVAKRLLRIAIDHLTTASKEREAAITMLVRLALRPDMRNLSLHEVLIRWAIEQLKDAQGLENLSTHEMIGPLSFLANIIKSAETGDIFPFLLYVFSSIQRMNILFSGKSSGLSRKATIKIYRACCVSALQMDGSKNDEKSVSNVTGQLLEEAIDDLLTALGDAETPVRQAASKALSVITLKLDPPLAADILDAVIGGLEEKVFWESIPELTENGSLRPGSKTIRKRNFTAVNHLRWQGLTLTLAHLVYRRCIPTNLLPSILNCLILALSFEKRSPSGASMGSSVRDAACFGIWGLARRYSTPELLDVAAQSVIAVQERVPSSSIPQLLAVELIVTAATDPSGNIRRGASAALQELVGRHPDTIKRGISLVQTVDYHAIALRSKAMRDVASKTASLAQDYWHALLQELCTWRGIGAFDVESRRLAAETIGTFSTFSGVESLQAVTNSLWQSLNTLDGGSVQKRHGFLLSLAAVVRAWAKLESNETSAAISILAKYWDIFSDGFFLAEKDFTSATSRPELVAEGATALMFELASASSDQLQLARPSKSLLNSSFKYLNLALERREPVVLETGARAARALLNISAEKGQDWVKQAVARCVSQQKKTTGSHVGFLIALSSAYSADTLIHSFKVDVMNAILKATETSVGIDIKVVAVSCISKIIHSGCILDAPIVQVLKAALEDYTTDQRGDIGSLLRVEAIDAIVTAYKSGSLQESSEANHLLAQISTLAGEKLDKVRLRAWNCISLCWGKQIRCGPVPGEEHDAHPRIIPVENTDVSIAGKEDPLAGNDTSNVTSTSYFSNLLSMFCYKPLRVALMRGIISSVGGGSESVLNASRAALGAWLEALSSKGFHELCECFGTILYKDLTIERVLMPTLDTLAFILDTQVMRNEDSRETINWRRLFILVQKAHFKSTSMGKLASAVDVYACLGRQISIRTEVLKKLSSFLTHPFPRIRNAAADALFQLTQDDSMTVVNWSNSPKDIRVQVAEVRQSLLLAM